MQATKFIVGFVLLVAISFVVAYVVGEIVSERRGSSVRVAPAPAAAPATTRPPATTTTSPPTTTTMPSECETRRAWLREDGERYQEAGTALVERFNEYHALGASADESDHYAALGAYIRAYERPFDLWERYEADAESLLRDCWDEFSPEYVDGQREYLADQRDSWRAHEEFCRRVREVIKSDFPDSWQMFGIPC